MTSLGRLSVSRMAGRYVSRANCLIHINDSQSTYVSGICRLRWICNYALPHTNCPHSCCRPKPSKKVTKRFLLVTECLTCFLFVRSTLKQGNRRQQLRQQCRHLVISTKHNVVFNSGLLALVCENITSSTKPEVHKHCIVRSCININFGIKNIKHVLYLNKNIKNRIKPIRHQLCYLQFETGLTGYRDSSGLL